MRSRMIAIDVGNSHTVGGLFPKGRLSVRRRGETAALTTVAQWERFLRDMAVGSGWGSMVSSVVPRVDGLLRLALTKVTGSEPVWAGPHLDTGIRIRIPRPSTLGADRLVNAAYGFHRFGGPLILIDFGTATTLCAVSGNGEYLGGAILPGLGISMDALSQRAAKLPSIQPRGPLPRIGRTTEAAMRLGAVEGHRGAVERIGEQMKRELGPRTRVVATGGFARLLCRGVPFIDRVEPDLTLRALHFLYMRNLPCPSKKRAL